MRIKTFIEFRLVNGVYEFVREEAYEYDGPMALCDRTQSKQVAAQGLAQSEQQQKDAQTSFDATNKSLGDYSNKLNNFMKFGRQTYGKNGEFAQDQNTIANTTAAAGSNAIAGNLALNKLRTGENTANNAATVAESQRSADRDLTTQLATADQNRLQQLTSLNQFGVQSSALPAQVQAGLYGTGTGGASSNLNPAAEAAKMPGFADQLTGELIQGAATVGAGFAAGACPCEGSMILMADGSVKPVEQLKKGDFVWPMGVLNPPNEILETPQPQQQPCWEIETVDGRTHRASASHTMALARGGYAFMSEMAGKVAIGELKAELIAHARDIGPKTVYPLSVGGSHCYVADGMLILA